MPARKSRKTNNNVYSHIYNKVVENRKLFNDKEDYETFLNFLKEYLTPPPDPNEVKKSFSVKGRVFQGVPHQLKNYFNKIELIAYNLMPDHFHLLVRQITKGSLERLIRSLCTRYVIYYNKKYRRRGSLFSGPYKSVQIKDVSQLLHLTRYLHREPLKENNVYSSYKEYLGIRKTSWIKPKVVISYFDKSENDYFKGIKGYKNFVKKYQPKKKDKEMLERIIIESKTESLERIAKDSTSKPLERRILEPEKTKSFKAVSSGPVSEPRLKIPEFFATVIITFVMLFTIGIRNIKTSEAQIKNSLSSIPSPTPQVSGVKDAKPEPKEIIVIKISDGAESVNIRKKPTTKSEKVGKAKDGDTFELVSKDSEWYQIKLDDESIAFVSARYAEIEGKENK